MPAKGHINHDIPVKTPAPRDAGALRHRRPGPSYCGPDRPHVVSIRPCSVTVDDNVVTVLIADDHPVVREGLVELISATPDMRVIAMAANGREAVEQYFARRPDVGLFDLRMPIMDGVDVVLAIRKQEPAARIAMISSFQNEEEVYRVVQAGAKGYALKDSAPEELMKCIRAVNKGEMWIPPAIAAKLANRVATRKLTAKEIDVLHFLASGKSNKEIGNQLNISEATVKVHVTHIFEKLKVTGRTQAIGVAVNRGLVDLDVRAAA